MPLMNVISKSAKSLGVLAFGFFLFKLTFAHIDADPQAIQVLQQWVSSEYVRYNVDREDISLQEKAELLEYATEVEFSSVECRGKPDDMIFRVELKPNPAQPPNKPLVRYFRMKHSLLTGWDAAVPTSSGPLSYFFALFLL